MGTFDQTQGVRDPCGPWEAEDRAREHWCERVGKFRIAMARPELCDHHSNVRVARKPDPKGCGDLRRKSDEVSIALHNEHWFVCRGDPSHVPVELPALDQGLGG